MSIEEILTYSVTLLCGGVIGAFVNWYRSSRLEKKERETETLKSQIQNLYGPLCFYTSQNEIYFKHYNKLHQAYQVEYSNPQ